MNTKIISFLVIAFLAGIFLTGSTASYAVNHGNSNMMGAFGMHNQNTASIDNTPDHSMGMMDQSDSSSLSMSNMVTSLKGKTGDDFDKEFLTAMIVHHEGAVSMAKLAAEQAKHQEVKDLANTIIAAQNNEITQMHAWQKNWGY